MKPQTIYRGKKVTLYFLVILLMAMVFNMVTGAFELYGDPAAANAWYWALIGVGAIYAVPIVLLLFIHIFFRFKARKLQDGKPRFRED